MTLLKKVCLFSCSIFFHQSLLQAEPSIRVTGEASLVQTRNNAVLIRKDAAEGEATVQFRYTNPPLDLSDSIYMSVIVDNNSSSKIDIHFMALNDGQPEWRHRAEARFLVRPGAQEDLKVLLARGRLDDSDPVVQKLGNLYGYPGGFHALWSYLILDKVNTVRARITWSGGRVNDRISIHFPKGDEAFYTGPGMLDGLQLPILDSFGQLIEGDWPSKVQSAEDLKKDGIKDLELIQQAEIPSERNRFGGWTKGPQLEATGFFRVKKIEDKWWLVDPEGRLFWSVGVTGVGRGVVTSTRNREELFSNNYGYRVNFYEENLALKYGSEHWQERHIDVTNARLRKWGLNTIGAWSEMPVMITGQTPYTLMIHTEKEGIGEIGKIPDPFDSVFRNSLNSQLADLAETHAENPMLLGIFIHNELHWAFGPLMNGIMNSPNNIPARIAFLEFIEDRYERIENLNQTWGTSFASFEDIRTVEGDTTPDSYQQDREDFYRIFVTRYFEICRQAMNLHFPNHLYLGARFHNFHRILTEVASLYCDVISVNIYRYRVDNFSIRMKEDRPFLITEFHFGVKDRGIWARGLTGATDLTNQQDLYKIYVGEALQHPNFVGAHWFQWSDQPTTGRFDGENFGIGVVSIVDRPNESLIEAIRFMSERVFEKRLSN